MTAELQQRDVSEINTYNIQTCLWMGGTGSHPGLPGTWGRLLPVTLEASRVIPKSDKKLPWHNVMRGNIIPALWTYSCIKDPWHIVLCQEM